MENPGDRTTQISEMVEDKTSTSFEADVPSLNGEACSIPVGIMATEVPDSSVHFLPEIGNSNRIKEIPYRMNTWMITELCQKYRIPNSDKMKKPMSFSWAYIAE